MTHPQRLRRQARKMRRYGLQPTVVINPRDPLPELAIVTLGRLLWRYRSELTPPALAFGAALAASILHAQHPRWWPAFTVTAAVGVLGIAIAGVRLGLASRAERCFAMTVIAALGGWLAAATDLGPGRQPLPWLLVISTGVLGVPWWAHRRRRAKVRVERLLAAWPEIAPAVGLAGSRVMSAVVDVWGWRAQFGLARGQTITDVIAKLPAIESGLGTFRGAARVYPTPDDLANRFELRVLDKDPHADAITWPGPSVASITEPIDLGPFEDAMPARVLLLRRHALFGGATGSGKSGGLNVLMGNLTACTDVVIWAIDLKRGMELTLTGRDEDFVMGITDAYTGMRWSEVCGLMPRYVLPGDMEGDMLDVQWKLYELGGHFYRGRPKDGSIRPNDVPPFLAELLAAHMTQISGRRCSCRKFDGRSGPASGTTWCTGGEYVFLSPGGGHYRRSTFGERYFRPAADGWYPERAHRSSRPVLIDTRALFPGLPLAAWPAAVPGAVFMPPTGRGVTRFISDPNTARCAVCRRAFRRRLDDLVISHKCRGARCDGSGQPPGEDVAVACWVPIIKRLTPHGYRHGLKVWMDEDQIADVLKSERLGHDEPSMRGVYGHVSSTMREELKTALQARWEDSLRQRAQISARSAVPTLDALLLATGNRSMRPRS
jgi:hypothetical protein